jgi:hypothetical protein
MTSMPAPAFDWNSLAHEWHDQTPPPRMSHAAIRRRVALEGAVLWFTVGGELLLCALMVAVSREILISSRSPFWLAWMAVNWILFFAISAFAVHNRRGLFSTEDETSSGYVDLSMRRADARIRVARGVRVFTGIQALIALPLLLLVNAMATDQRAWSDILPATGTSAAVAVLFAAWSVWYQRRALLERDALAQLAAAMDNADNDGMT